MYYPHYLQEKVLQYDPFLIPPNMDHVKMHSKAKQVGLVQFNRLDEEARTLCPCCNMPVEKMPLSLCVSTRELGFLGQGYTLFFQGIQLCLLLLVFTCPLVGVYNIVTTSELCYNDYSFSMLEANDGCYHFIGIAYSTLKSDDQLTIQAVLSLCGTLFISIGLYAIKYYQFRNQTHKSSPSDFTILMRNVPTHLTMNDINQYFQEHFGEVSIVKGFHALSVEHYIADQNKKQYLLSEQRRIFARFSSPKDITTREEQLQKQMRDIQVLDRQIAKYEEQLSLDETPLRTGYVFVTMSEDIVSDRILFQSQLGLWQQFIDDLDCCDDCYNKDKQFSWQYIAGRRITLKRAPQPLDIQWEHLSISHQSKRIRRFASIIASLMLIVVGSMIVYGISYSQNNIQKQKNRFYLNYVLSGLCALAILIVNYLLEWLVKRTSKFEKHSTYTHETRSIVMTQTIMQFINTALVPFGLFLFTDFDQNNLAASLFFIFIGNVILLPFLELFDPLYCYQLHLRKKILQKGFQTEYTQQQANKIYEGPDYRIADKYSTIYKSVLMCTFYMCIFPYGSILQVLSLFVYYWACKYTLLRRCAWPADLSADLHESVYQLMTFLPLVMAAGGICYEYVLIKREVNLIIHIFNLVIAGVCCIALQVISVKNKVANSRVYNYNEMKHDFQSDYERCNPITRNVAQEEWKQMWK